MATASPQVSSNDQFARASVAELKEECLQERRKFRVDGIPTSPACVELFRRAFRNDQAAWSAVLETFQAQITGWKNVISAELRLAADFLDPEDVLQQSLLSFYRSAPKNPALIASDDLSHLLAYLRSCVKTALLEELRRRRHEPAQPVSLEDVPHLAHQTDWEYTFVERQTLHEYIDTLLESDEERLVFLWRFNCGAKPEEIVRQCGDRFAHVDEVYQVIQRLIRRLRKDPTLQTFYGSRAASRRKPEVAALLKIELANTPGEANQQEGIDVNNQCHFSEAILLDYVTGMASAETIAQIEGSPACLQAAQQLADELLPLLPVLYRIQCPVAATLTDYQERTLKGTAYLVVHRHVAQCPLCQEELRLLAAIDQVPLVTVPTPLRRIVEALFQPLTQLPQAVRGGVLLHYQTPQLFINLNTRAPSGQQRTWRLSGQLRTPDGQLFTGVEGILLRQLDLPEAVEQRTTLTITGTFIFAGLPPGKYSLTVLTAEEEIVIREIVVGDEP
jgi:DNA-directed RNA polymerase specialized sigma24 family protein